jgi:hypothetical protein
MGGRSRECEQRHESGERRADERSESHPFQ